MFGKIRLFYFVNGLKYAKAPYQIHKINGKYAIRKGSYPFVRKSDYRYIDLDTLDETNTFKISNPHFANCLGSASKVLKVFKKLIAPPVHYTIEQIYN